MKEEKTRPTAVWLGGPAILNSMRARSLDGGSILQPSGGLRLDLVFLPREFLVDDLFVLFLSRFLLL